MRLTILLFFLLFTFINTFSQTYKTVDVDDLNIRDRASSNSEIVGKLKRGETVTVNSVKGSWAEIKTTNGLNGFVASKYLTEKETTENTTKQKSTDSNGSDWVTIILGLIGIIYFLSKINKFFSGLFSSKTTNSKTSPSKASIEEYKATNCIASIDIQSEVFLKTFNAKGQKIATKTLSQNEKYLGYSQLFFITLTSDTFLKLYDPECEKISGLTLHQDEKYQSCSGNTFTIIRNNTFLITYDSDCKKVSSRTLHKT